MLLIIIWYFFHNYFWPRLTSLVSTAIANLLKQEVFSAGVDDGRQGRARPAHHLQLQQIRTFQQLGRRGRAKTSGLSSAELAVCN